MSNTPRFTETVLGGTSGFVVIDAIFGWLDVLLVVSDYLFTVMVVMQGTLAPEIGWLSQSSMRYLLLFVAMMYVANLGFRIKDDIRNGT